jgi:hypothetical protein
MIVAEFPAPELQEPTNITENSMDLAWTIISDSDFQEYRLYRSNSTGVDENSTLVATITNAYENFYNDTGLDGGTSYYYRVYSASTNGVTAGSNEISAATSLELGNWGLVHSFDNSIYLNAIYAFSDDNVWVVGEQVLDEGNSSLGISVIYHYAQGDWIEITCPDIGGLSDIDFSSPSNGWAVGGDGAIHYNGVSWTMDSTLSSYYSYGGWVDVDVNDDNDVWFVSPDQGIRHLYNGAYSQLDIDRPVDISVNNDNNFGVILTRYLSAGVSFYDGFSWTQDTAFTSLMDGHGVISKIIMFDDNDFIMLSMPNIHPLSGPISALLYYNFNEESWTTYPNDEFYSSYAMDALSSNYIWLMAFGAANNSWNDDNGFTIFWDGSSWRYVDTPLASPQFEPWSDIDFFEIGTGWGCGGNKVYRYN